MVTHRIDTTLGIINVQVSGSGPAMLCWPSLLMNGEMWRAQAEYFSDRYRVVMIDSPGHGASEALNRHFTMDDCAHCLVQILDALEIKDCVLLGNSWGGMMGGVFAALYPERARAAVLMNCTASAVGWSQKLEFLAMTAVLRRCNKFPMFMAQRAVSAFAGETTEKTKPDVVKFIRDTVSEVDPRSVHWAIRSVVPYRTDRHTQLQAIKCPVLVLAGEEDRTFPVLETKAMADAIPNSQFVVLPRIGHLAALESPAVVNGEIDKFLAGVFPSK
ncbi:alpha/beta fold hydrolase [Stenotrophobium rhamnosiphilum]|uniref:Alpha/beta hydrolase n=1 Tax=Stenotrophobium rhamnosiphilum TaxID=2029166 RepID=A0A2T5MIU9_9GAMM|nr:alpha/beta hydrolase [Stenotrophobium rhamnosiphilum]PTU32500.1 alpha/beta hydrolase [Stenotrophobium rhamnosiphilum]